MSCFRRIFGFMVATALLGSSIVFAGDMSDGGYAELSGGNILRSSDGGCVHTSTFKPEMANIVGCDGFTLDLQVEVIKGEHSGLLGSIVIPEAALFAFDSADLTEPGKQAIDDMRSQLKPNIIEAYAGVIIGHADSSGAAEYNMGLSLRRAEAVGDYLISTGVDASIVRAVGVGEQDPIASNDTEEGRAENRRVEVFAIAEARALDGVRFPSVALFPRRSGVLSEEGKAMLASNQANAREMLSQANYIEVVGHTDSVGDDAYNQDLSEQRAAAVRGALIASGVDANKIVAVGMGESAPIASNKTEEGRAENRRVEVLVLGRTKN